MPSAGARAVPVPGAAEIEDLERSHIPVFGTADVDATIARPV
jgi:hypothetical protein